MERIRMLNRFIAVVLVFLACDTAFAAPLRQITKHHDKSLGKELDVVSGEILVKFKPRTTSRNISAFNRLNNCRVLKRIDAIDVYKIEIPQDRTMDEILATYNSNPAVEYAEPIYLRNAFLAPNDPDFSKQWGLNSLSDVDIDAPEGWDVETGKSGVIIAIVDSGVDLDHPDLLGKMTPGYDFVNDDNLADDDFGHGTHVAGIAAAKTNNGVGIAGVSWDSRIMPVKVLNSGGVGDTGDVAEGITYAADNGAKVINLSLGGEGYDQAEKDAIDYAYDKGCVICAAMGNANSSNVMYPAGFDNVIAVGAIDITGSRAGFSNYGAHIDVVAPGQDIYSCYNNGDYGYQTGTSMATPFVAGLCALLLSRNGELTNVEIMRIVGETADDIASVGWDIYTGSGTIIVYSALSAVTAGLPSQNLAKIGNNCFNPTESGDNAIIYYEVSAPAPVTVTIYNMLGEEITTLIDNEDRDPGRYSVDWTGRNALSQVVASGMYFINVRIGNEVKKNRVMVVK